MDPIEKSHNHRFMARRMLLWGFRPAEDLDALGHTERDVLATVCRLGQATVHDVRAALGRDAAYTTVMTVLDRLFKKGVLDRHRQGRAYVYAAVASPEQIHSSVAMKMLDRVLGGAREAVAPVLSNLVDAVGDKDRQLLDELDRLVREKRRRLDEEDRG
jgi:predicted transcriptional regulator